MTFADQLRKMDACHKAVVWVGDRTLQQAWDECERGDWMAWFTRELGLDSLAAASDMAERVWHLVEPESQLACAWAIDCARRGADDDERGAAVAAAGAAGAAGDAARAAAGAAWAAGAAGAAAWAAESKAQAYIMREHFSAEQIAEALAALERGDK